MPLSLQLLMLRKPNLNPKQTYKGTMDGFEVIGFLGTPGQKSFKLEVSIRNSDKTKFRPDFLDHDEEKKPIVENAIRRFQASPEFRDSGNDNQVVRDACDDFINRLYNR